MFLLNSGFCFVQLVSKDQDGQARDRWQKLMGAPKEGPWGWMPAPYSQSVRLLDPSGAHRDVGLLGKGGLGRVE